MYPYLHREMFGGRHMSNKCKKKNKKKISEQCAHKIRPKRKKNSRNTALKNYFLYIHIKALKNSCDALIKFINALIKFVQALKKYNNALIKLA